MPSWFHCPDWAGQTWMNNFWGKILKKGKALVQNFQVPMTVGDVCVALAEHSPARSHWSFVSVPLRAPLLGLVQTTSHILSLPLPGLWILTRIFKLPSLLVQLSLRIGFQAASGLWGKESSGSLNHILTSLCSSKTPNLECVTLRMVGKCWDLDF